MRVVAVALLLFAAGPVLAEGNCIDGETNRMSTEALADCEARALALNNRAVELERGGSFDAAEELYREAAAMAGAGAIPFAGLGDVLAAQGRFGEAAHAYRRFLARLPAEKRRGDPLGLAPYEDAYRDRLQAAEDEALAALQKGEVVTATRLSEELMPGEAMPPADTGGVVLGEVTVMLAVDPKTGEVRHESLEQLAEIAAALQGEALSGRRLRLGSAHGRAANDDTRLAAAAAGHLVGRFHVDPDRLITPAYGSMHRGIAAELPAGNGEAPVYRSLRLSLD